MLTFTISSVMFSQMKRPILMFMPSKAWMYEQGYTIKQDLQGVEVVSMDYEKALLQNKDLQSVLSMLEEEFTKYDYPIKDFQTIYNLYKEQIALGEIVNFPEAEITIEVSWKVAMNGPKRKIEEFTLRGFDSYTNKIIAQISGSGNWIVDSKLSNTFLIKESILTGIDLFNSNILSFINNTFDNGREITLGISTSFSWDGDLESEFKDNTIASIIEEWISKNTIKNQYHLMLSTNTKMNFDQLRIPVLNANQESMSSLDWIRMLQKELKNNYGIPCKINAESMYKIALEIGK